MQKLIDVLHNLREKWGVTAIIGIELEFYFTNLDNCDSICELVNCINNDLKKLNAQIVPESSPLQYEIQTDCYRDVVLLLKHLDSIKQRIYYHTTLFGGEISFAAKPILSKAGSALHVHFNLIDKDNCNLFNNQIFPDEHFLLYSVGGLCHNMIRDMPIFAPYQESYLRYQFADIYTPTTVSWGNNNRSVAIRLPCTTGYPEKRRLEHRVAGADCNPTKVLFAIFGAVLNGIENKIIPPIKTYGNSSDQQYKLPRLHCS